MARPRLEPGYAPSKRPGRSLGIQPGPEPIPTEGPRETAGPGKRTLHSLGVPGYPRSGRAHVAAQEASESPLRLRPAHGLHPFG